MHNVCVYRCCGPEMTSSEALNGPPSPTAADQQSSGFDANSSSNAINTPRPRVFKMSDGELGG
jgi:hypothetical protein